MGFLDKLRSALTGARAAEGMTAPGTSRGAGSTSPSPADLAARRTGSPGPRPKRTLPLFIHRASALTPDQWRGIEATWQSAMADPARVVARAAAQERAEALEAETSRSVEMTSEVHIEFADERSRLLATASSRMRQRIATLESQLQTRRAIMRDALEALSVRDLLPAADFDVLYGPFDAFVPRAELELEAEDWTIATSPAGAGVGAPSQAAAQPTTSGTLTAPEPESSLPRTSLPEPGSLGDPLRPGPEMTAPVAPGPGASPAESDPWRDVSWTGVPPEENESTEGDESSRGDAGSG